jgi:hypothetical protein
MPHVFHEHGLFDEIDTTTQIAYSLHYSRLYSELRTCICIHEHWKLNYERHISFISICKGHGRKNIELNTILLFI